MDALLISMGAVALVGGLYLYSVLLYERAYKAGVKNGMVIISRQIRALLK